jgi:hypothetical protein
MQRDVTGRYLSILIGPAKDVSKFFWRFYSPTSNNLLSKSVEQNESGGFLLTFE